MTFCPFWARHQGLHHEAPAVGQLRSRAGEAAHLIGLGGQSEQRAERDQHQLEAPGVDRRTHVALVQVHRRAAGLATQLLERRWVQVDAVNLQPGLRQRDRQPAGAHPQLQQASPRGQQPAHPSDRLLRLGRVRRETDHLVYDPAGICGCTPTRVGPEVTTLNRPRPGSRSGFVYWDRLSVPRSRHQRALPP